MLLEGFCEINFFLDACVQRPVVVIRAEASRVGENGKVRGKRPARKGELGALYSARWGNTGSV